MECQCRLARLISLTDIAPTIVELAGAEVLPDIDGRLLIPLIDREPGLVWRDVVGLGGTWWLAQDTRIFIIVSSDSKSARPHYTACKAIQYNCIE